MLEVLLLVLVILWFFGYITIPGLVIPKLTLFYISGRPVTLWEFLIFIVIVSTVKLLPSPFWEIATVLVVLWLLSALGIIVIAGIGLTHLLLITIIVGLVFYLLVGPKSGQ